MEGTLMAANLIQKIDCIRLYVADLDEGLAFYRDTLGHELIWRSEDQVGLCIPGSKAEIVLHTESQPPEIDFSVDATDEAVARFEKAGGTVVVPPFEIQIGKCAVVRDPWGNQFVLLDSSKGTLVTDDEGNVIGNVAE
jgi:predicted enzyme related to lactoylglutathione lyase